eukprot:6179806-Pyramimonas_sp.AAC.1
MMNPGRSETLPGKERERESARLRQVLAVPSLRERSNLEEGARTNLGRGAAWRGQGSDIVCPELPGMAPFQSFFRSFKELGEGLQGPHRWRALALPMWPHRPQNKSGIPDLRLTAHHKECG